jgi:hypothetical protein
MIQCYNTQCIHNTSYGSNSRVCSLSKIQLGKNGECTNCSRNVIEKDTYSK